MYFLYSVLLSVGVTALLPRFMFDAVRHGKYAAGFRERLGELLSINVSGEPVIWLHCVSVGETQAARPLVRALLERFPTHRLVVSTTTLTGQRVAREAFGETAAAVFYFPFDWATTVRRSLRAIKPSLVLVMETELWPRFLRECRAQGVPVVIINGRISETSFRRYRIINRFIKRVVNDLTLAVMQTEADAARIIDLGLAPERVVVSGNIKFDVGEIEVDRSLSDELRERFKVDQSRPLIVAASTHAPEERVLLAAFQQLRATADNFYPRLLIAPRHPERFGEVASLLDGSGLRWARRTGLPCVADSNCEAILLDTVGELRAVYPLAEVVFVGGSVARIGGHNILEPASAAKCVVTGAHTANFTSITEAFLERDALVQLPPVAMTDAPVALARVLADLLNDGARRRRVGENAFRALQQNRGATARTVELLAPLITQSTETAHAILMKRAVSTSDI